DSMRIGRSVTSILASLALGGILIGCGGASTPEYEWSRAEVRLDPAGEALAEAAVLTIEDLDVPEFADWLGWFQIDSGSEYESALGRPDIECVVPPEPSGVVVTGRERSGEYVDDDGAMTASGRATAYESETDAERVLAQIRDGALSDCVGALAYSLWHAEGDDCHSCPIPLDNGVEYLIDFFGEVDIPLYWAKTSVETLRLDPVGDELDARSILIEMQFGGPPSPGASDDGHRVVPFDMITVRRGRVVSLIMLSYATRLGESDRVQYESGVARNVAARATG
ncbi:MAG: hypothetical protein OEW52_13085, partial [Thermoleophilia bacterium]|nr:hypothetical protein [Thermoleophilia bacterium]